MSIRLLTASLAVSVPCILAGFWLRNRYFPDKEDVAAKAGSAAVSAPAVTDRAQPRQPSPAPPPPPSDYLSLLSPEETEELLARTKRRYNELSLENDSIRDKIQRVRQRLAGRGDSNARE
ncbi:hypothetical protein RI367_005128 [Sorochytrium milnesiophthora]